MCNYNAVYIVFTRNRGNVMWSLVINVESCFSLTDQSRIKSDAVRHKAKTETNWVLPGLQYPPLEMSEHIDRKLQY